VQGLRFDLLQHLATFALRAKIEPRIRRKPVDPLLTPCRGHRQICELLAAQLIDQNQTKREPGGTLAHIFQAIARQAGGGAWITTQSV
jgi:hypothetical protein